MFEALVARVRYHIQKANFMGLKEAEFTLLLAEAADAIEELSKRVDESISKHDAEIIIEEVSKPRWIPVTERLPEEYQDVLCYYEYFRYGEYNCMFRTIDRGYYGDGRWGGEAGQGHKNKVLYWMPLPKGPKED